MVPKLGFRLNISRPGIEPASDSNSLRKSSEPLTQDSLEHAIQQHLNADEQDLVRRIVGMGEYPVKRMDAVANDLGTSNTLTFRMRRDAIFDKIGYPQLRQPWILHGLQRKNGASAGVKPAAYKKVSIFTAELKEVTHPKFVARALADDLKGENPKLSQMEVQVLSWRFPEEIRLTKTRTQIANALHHAHATIEQIERTGLQKLGFDAPSTAYWHKIDHIRKHPDSSPYLQTMSELAG